MIKAIIIIRYTDNTQKVDEWTSGETVYRSIDYIKDGKKRQKTQTDTETNRSITLKLVKLKTDSRWTNRPITLKMMKETGRQQIGRQTQRETDL